MFLLLIAVAALLWPFIFSQSLEGNLLTAKAQGNTSNSKATTTRTQRDTEGATITANRITLKPGYKFTRVSANKIAVRKKNGGKIVVAAACKCKRAGQGGSTACGISIEGADLVCSSSGCADCFWGAPTRSR